MNRSPYKRMRAALFSCVYLSTCFAGNSLLTAAPARAVTSVCATPGKDGSAGTLGGVYDAYFAPVAGTLAAGATSVTLTGAADTAGGGANTAITAGDLLLIMQMQDGSFNQSNSASYGDGSTGSGYTSLSSAGLYEYVTVVSVAGNTVTIQGAGSGNGTINTYHEAAATGVAGQETYQVIRVPQYVTATLGSNFTAAYWDGQTGGVAALDIASTLNLGGANIYVTGDGFRGGGYTPASSAAAGWTSADFGDSSTQYGGSNTKPGFASKGEGVMGTPNYLFYYTNFTAPANPTAPTVTSSGVNGYPGGDQARGAPGNAGGGGVDDDPAANDQNTGGGGGGNGGAGGNGGFPWTPTYTSGSTSPPNTAEYYPYSMPTSAPTYNAANFHDVGGRGAGALTPSVPRVFLGGGGGAGVNNNSSNNNTYNKYGSSGGTGGGIVMMRIANASGTAATIYAAGTTGLAPSNDGGGGGGAGGSVLITSPSSFSGFTIHADGAAGTTANAGPADIREQHGPGGGGGGGVVLSSSPVTASVSGGAAGTTTTWATTYGATGGSAGVTNTAVSASSIPGVGSGAECSSVVNGTNTLYTGPYDASEATYAGADETGSFDGSSPVTNNNDFAPALIPLTGLNTINGGTAPGTPVGNAITLGTIPTIDVPHTLYWQNSGTSHHVITLIAQAPVAPSGWTAQICADTASPAGTIVPLSPGPSSADCSYTGPIGGCTTTFGWMSVGADNPTANTYTAQYCMRSGNGARKTRALSYWVRYTPPAALTAFTRYDGSVAAYDDASPAAYNATHDELYAGDVALTKSFTVVSNGCPAGATPVYSALGVCPGGVLRYTIDYRNIVAGGGAGTEGNITSIFAKAISAGGSLVLTDDGTLSGVSQTTTPNWSTFTNGLSKALQSGITNTSCGSGASACGDTTSGTTYTYDALHASGIGATKFTATIGGAAFTLYPVGVGGQIGQGTITFAVTIK